MKRSKVTDYAALTLIVDLQHNFTTVSALGIALRHCIRINFEGEVGREKSVPRITDCHHEACRVMTIGDREGRIFLSHPRTNDKYFFLLAIKYQFSYTVCNPKYM